MKLQLYILRTVAIQIFAAALILMSILQILDLLDVTSDILDRGLGVAGVAYYAALRLPRLFEQVAPISVLAGGLFAFSGLARESAIVAMRASGISGYRIVGMAVPAAVAVMLLDVLCAQVLAPRADPALADWWKNTTPVAERKTPAPRTFRAGGDLVTAAQASADGRELSQITIYRRDAKGLLTEKLEAPSAQYQPGGGWMLRQPKTTRFTGEIAQTSTADSARWPNRLNPQDVQGLFGGDALPTERATVALNYPDNVPAVSDILLFDSYSKAATPSACTKSGYDFVPRVFPFYGANADKLQFYAELYNSNKLYSEGKYLISYYIEAAESSSLMQDYHFTKRYDVAQATPLINNIDIKMLPSGNYYLVVEMRDRSNAVICSNSVFFQRSNPGVGYSIRDLSGVNIANTFVSSIDNIDTLRRYIRYLEPVCTESERDYGLSLVRTDDVTTMQQFIYNFWSTRSPMNPADAFHDYLTAVYRVNQSFTTTSTPGYRTDRGYVFLKYGQPDQIVESPNEPGAYPYQIWHYYVVANQRNKKFVFMSKDDSTNDYQLIHSDVIGELSNYRWKLEVYSRIYGEHYDEGIDQTDYEEGWGKRAGDMYDNPR